MSEEERTSITPAPPHWGSLLLASHLREERQLEKIRALRHSAAVRMDEIEELEDRVARLERQLASSKERETSLWRACKNWETACQIWESRAELLEERHGPPLVSDPAYRVTEPRKPL